MARFAQISSDGYVTAVVVVPDEQEQRGEEFLSVDLGLGGRWVQTSYNGTIRKRLAGIGMIYSVELDMFIDPQPAVGWTIDGNGDWQLPADPGDDYTAAD